MAFRIRRAVIEDAAAIARVQVASWRTTYRGIVPESFLEGMSEQVRERSWRKQLENPGTLLWVAEDSIDNRAEVVGFVCGGASREPFAGYDGELYAIYLLEHAQKRGGGVALVRALAGGFRAEGYQGMVVWVLTANPAVGFYKRMGAHAISGKVIEIDGVRLPELAFGWPSLTALE